MDPRDAIPNISSLHQTKNVKQVLRNNVFNIVLKKCIEKILYTNTHTDQTFIMFEVPNILIGFPSYDRMSCIRFLIEQLINKDYLIKYIEPFYLYIDWGTNKNKNSGIKLDNIQNYIKTNNPEKLKTQTQNLLNKFPNTSKIVFEYGTGTSSSKKKK